MKLRAGRRTTLAGGSTNVAEPARVLFDVVNFDFVDATMDAVGVHKD